MKLDLNFDFFGELKESHQPRPSKSSHDIQKVWTVDRWGVGAVTMILIFENVIEIFGKK